MAQLPFVRDIMRRSQLRPVIRQFNPQRGNSATAGITGIPKIGVGNLTHMAHGGRYDDGGEIASGSSDGSSNDNLPYDPTQMTQNPNWINPSNVSYDQPTAQQPQSNGIASGFGQDDGGATAPSAPAQAATAARSALQDLPSFATTDSGTPSASGFKGWLQSQHGGIKGSDWVKAGLTALSGILSGISNKRAQGVAAGQTARTNTQYAPTFKPIGVPLAFRTGGPVTPNVRMNSPMEPAVYMATGGPVTPNVHMTSPMEPAVWMARGGIASQVPVMGGTTGGMLHGPGDGMSDSISASSPSGNNVRVGDGEYVVDADSVAQAGNGSSNAGARKLDRAIMELRKKKHGRTMQPPKLSDGSNPLLKALK